MKKSLVALLIVSITTSNLHSDSTLVVSSNHHISPLLVAGALTTAFVAGGCCAWNIVRRKQKEIDRLADLLKTEKTGRTLAFQSRDLCESILTPLEKLVKSLAEQTLPLATTPSTEKPLILSPQATLTSNIEKMIDNLHSNKKEIQSLRKQNRSSSDSAEHLTRTLLISQQESESLTKKLKDLLRMIAAFLNLEFSFENPQEVDLEPFEKGLDEKETHLDSLNTLLDLYCSKTASDNEEKASEALETYLAELVKKRLSSVQPSFNRSLATPSLTVETSNDSSHTDDEETFFDDSISMMD